MVPMSPPEPLTQSTRVGLPVNGSGWVSLAEVLPPPKLVTRLSAPSRLERYSSSSLGASRAAWVSSQRLGSNRESARDSSSAVSSMQQYPYGTPRYSIGAHYRSNLDQIWSMDNVHW